MADRPDPDVELMLSVRDGDEAAFQKLFQRYAGRLVAFADRFFHNRAQSEEVVQEIFLKIYRVRGRYEQRSRFSTWLYTIASRTCLKELRKHPRGRQQCLDDTARETIADSARPRADEAMAGQQLQEALQRCLDELPEHQRLALLLTRFEDRSYAEVAEILGVSEGAVKSLVFRAASSLRRVVDAREKPCAPEERDEVEVVDHAL